MPRNLASLAALCTLRRVVAAVLGDPSESPGAERRLGALRDGALGELGRVVVQLQEHRMAANAASASPRRARAVFSPLRLRVDRQGLRAACCRVVADISDPTRRQLPEEPLERLACTWRTRRPPFRHAETARGADPY